MAKPGAFRIEEIRLADWHVEKSHAGVPMLLPCRVGGALKTPAAILSSVARLYNSVPDQRALTECVSLEGCT
jgi:hypothetical protein